MKVYCISLVRNVFLGIYSDYNEVDGVDMYYKFTAPDLVYSAFQHDFGPYDLGCVYRLCSELSEGMMYNMGEPMMFLIGDSPKEKTNGITVMCLAMMWGFGMSPDDVFRPFVDLELLPFRDVCKGNSTMELSVMDVLNGFHKALKLGWHDISNFDEVEYEKMGKPRHGNMNWIVPGKFLAMATPMDEDFPEKE
jgi:cell division cycle 14